MAPLAIRLDPDPVLRVICDAVIEFDAGLAQFADQMLQTMYDAPGRGLAAPQVGITKRMFVVDVDWRDADPAPTVFVNPVLTGASVEVEELEEGCLSIPDSPCLVTRPVLISLQWQGLDGTWQSGAFDGALARSIQHENDHLNGVLCTDYTCPTAPI